MNTEELILQRLDTIIALLEANSQFQLGSMSIVMTSLQTIIPELGKAIDDRTNKQTKH